MNHRRRSPLKQATSLLLAASLLASQAGCASSVEVVNTDRVYLLGPKTESEPGQPTRDVTVRAVDTQGTLAFHVDRARECTVTSTPRFQRVHVEGKQGKHIASGIITGALLTAAGGGLIAASFAVSPDGWTEGSSSNATFTGGGYLGLLGVIVGIVGLVYLPRGIYHAAISGVTVTPQDVEAGTPPPGALRAPAGYDPKNPEISAFVPRLEQPRYDFMAFGTQRAEDIKGIPSWARPVVNSGAVIAPVQPVSRDLAGPDLAAEAGADAPLRRSHALESAVAEESAAADPALLAIPQSSGGGGGSDQMRACVQKYTPACQAKCGSDRSCVLACLRKPCVENLEQESQPGATDPRDEYTTVITRTEVCERSADTGTGIAVIVKDVDGVPKILDVGKTDRNGDVKKNVLAALESTYPGWPDIKQALLPEAQVVLVEDQSVVLGKLDLAKYPSLKYAEHAVSTKKQRDALAAAEAARKEKEEKDRQAALEAAAKAEDDALHADERKAEAAKKAAACASAHQASCNASCQGNQACVRKCLQKAAPCK